MFDIGGVELLVVAAIAILVVGPRELPGMLRGVGKFVRQAREMTSAVQRQFNDALKEAELDDVKKTFDDVRSLNPATQIRRTLTKEMKPLSEVGDRLKTSGSAGSIAKSKTDTWQVARRARRMMRRNLQQDRRSRSPSRV
jgi:sec-independent protein translocase protein TatB